MKPCTSVGPALTLFIHGTAVWPYKLGVWEIAPDKDRGRGMRLERVHVPWQEMGMIGASAVQRCHGWGTGVPQRGDTSSGLVGSNRL